MLRAVTGNARRPFNKPVNSSLIIHHPKLKTIYVEEVKNKRKKHNVLQSFLVGELSEQ